MDNELIKNIIEQFPRLALLVGCIGVAIWIVKSLMEIRSKRHISKLNKKVLEVTLSSIKSKELIDKLNYLQDSISELEKASMLVSNETLSSQIEKVDNSIEALVSKLPKDWVYQKNIKVDIEWLNEFTNVVQFLKNIPETEESLNEITFRHLVEDFSKKVESSFFVIEELISSVSRYKKEADHTINWIATVKGAAALCILISFSLGIVSYNKVQNDITYSEVRFANLSREKENEITQLRQSLTSSQNQLEDSETKIGTLAKNLDTLKKERETTNSKLALVNERVATISRGLGVAGGGKMLVNEFEELGALLEELNVTDSEEDLNIIKSIIPYEGEIEIRLNWDGGADLDLMLRIPSGEIITYRNPVSRSLNGRLQDDVRHGPGEERIVVRIPIDGTYMITVNNYSKNSFVNYKIGILVDNKEIFLKQGTVFKTPKGFKFTLQKSANKTLHGTSP